MRYRSSRTRVLAGAVTLFAALAAQAAGGLSVLEPWVRAVPPVSGMTAAYLVIENAAPAERTLLGARSPAVERIELHRTVTEAGVARMLQQASLPVPAGGRLVLQPGDYHLMLMGLKQPLAEGESLELELLFDGDQRLPVTAPVRKGMAPDDGHGHHHHHHPHP